MLLMEEAERIAYEEHGSHKISVISGIVVRSLHIQCVNWYFVCNLLYIMLDVNLSHFYALFSDRSIHGYIRRSKSGVIIVSNCLLSEVVTVMHPISYQFHHSYYCIHGSL